MKVSEMIEWLKSKDQSATIKVVCVEGDYFWDGEDETWEESIKIREFYDSLYEESEDKSGTKVIVLGSTE
ncbi:hypothetical protein D3C78_1817420 [compost metagenome]